jgi:hypothetical protein
VAHFSFEDVKDHLEADMNMGIGNAARWDRGDVGRQARRAHVFGGHALFIMNAVPIPASAAATNSQYSFVIFDRTELDVVFVVLHKILRSIDPV